MLLRARTGSDVIPLLVTSEGERLIGEDAILAYLAAREPVPTEARAHRLKAEKARRRYLGGGMRMPTATGYTLSATTAAPFEDTVERVRAELKQEGFGVLCEIDVQATLREKLGVEQEPYLILGACNPPLAHQALTAEPELGTLLPCNVAVYQHDGATHIAAIDPERMLSIVDNPELAPIAARVRDNLAAVVERSTA